MMTEARAEIANLKKEAEGEVQKKIDQFEEFMKQNNAEKQNYQAAASAATQQAEREEGFL